MNCTGTCLPAADSRSWPEALREAERLRLAQRRDGPQPALGIGLSGGGIRSATFALGVFQGIARRNPEWLRRLDYLSSVSGGGYFASFYGRLFDRVQADSPREGLDKVIAALRDGVLDCGDGRRAPVLDWLRENGRYLAPRGAGDFIVGSAVLLRNLFTVHLLMALSLITVLLLLQGPVAALAQVRPGWQLGEYLFLSPLILLPTAIFLLWWLPSGMAYWLVSRSTPGQQPGWEWSGGVGLSISLVIVLGLLLVTNRSGALFGVPLDQPMTGLVLLGALLSFGLAIPFALLSARKSAEAQRRRWLSGQSGLSLLALLLSSLLCLIDSLGQSLYFRLQDASSTEAWLGGSGAALLAALAAGGRRLAAGGGKALPRLLLRLGPGLLAVLLLVLIPSLFAALADGLASGFDRSPSDRVPALNLGFWLLSLLGAGALALAFGHNWSVLNRSSLQALYAARLARAYLGASNPDRFPAGRPWRDVTEVLADDDIGEAEYWPENPEHWRSGKPLHLVNVTINETVDGRSQRQRQDRKGIGMAIGPGGLSVGVRHHSVARTRTGKMMAQGLPPLGGARHSIGGQHPATGFAALPYQAGESWEPLRLSQWVGISGAAFSTGLGYRTRLGFSLLLGLANVRLGYWWHSRLTPQAYGKTHWPRLRRVFPVQSYLLDEWLARFRGPGQQAYWNLSDGGHFENLAGYELIRRRLPVILLIDAEADPESTFEGLANLVRKARIDFGADIDFLDGDWPDELGPHPRWLGSLNDLRRGPDGLCQAQAALARVRYRDHPEDRSWLLYLKAGLTKGSPADLHHYHAREPGFPHQTTGDQFFDEQQWESYRRLGELQAERLLAGLRFEPDLHWQDQTPER